MAAPRNDERAEKMRQLYDKGYSLDAVGGEFGVTGPTVLAIFRVRGWETRPTGKREVTDEDRAELGIKEPR